MNAHAQHDANHDANHDDGKVHAHVAPALFYWGIFGVLIFLTFLTVAVSYVDFGAANTVIAVVVATIKATLVATFFMHLLHDKLFNSIVLVMSFVFLGVFLFLTSEDMSTRNQLDEANGARRYVVNGELAPAAFPHTMIVAPHAEGHSEGHEKPKGAHH